MSRFSMSFHAALVVALMSALPAWAQSSRPRSPTSNGPTKNPSAVLPGQIQEIPNNFSELAVHPEVRMTYDPNGNMMREVRNQFREVDPRWVSEQREIAELMAQLRSKDGSEDDKAAIRKKISDILSKQFDRDLEQRVGQIDSLEKQITTLKSQIEKRRAAKERLIELRLELSLNEAEGLGFPSGWNQSMSASPNFQYGYPTSNFGGVNIVPPRPGMAPSLPPSIPTGSQPSSLPYDRVEFSERPIKP